MVMINVLLLVVEEGGEERKLRRGRGRGKEGFGWGGGKLEEVVVVDVGGCGWW